MRDASASIAGVKSFHGLVLSGLLLLLPGCDRLAAIASGQALQSFEKRCEALPAPRVQVNRVPNQVTEDASLPYGELARLSEPSATHHRTVGLTRAKFGYRSTLELDGLEDPRNGRACARPRVRIDVELSSLTVYIAREYLGDACREPLILAHERLHVEVFERYADQAAPALARLIEERFGRAVRYGTSMAAMQESLKAELAVHLELFMARAHGELTQRQAAVDTAREYDKLGNSCGSMP
jgi:hypothetical protein